MRFIGLDVHRDHCEVAIAEGGEVRSAGRIETRPQTLELFAQSLGVDDWVALESTIGATQIARIVEPHVACVVVANTRRLRSISSAKAKTDRRDARTLARLLASGFLEKVWSPTKRRGRCAGSWPAGSGCCAPARARRTRSTPPLARNLCPRPPAEDLFGRRGRSWLDGVELPEDERLSVSGCLRQIDFLDGEVTALDRALAERALRSPAIRRLMTVPA